jgi:hypothetical protein
MDLQTSPFMLFKGKQVNSLMSHLSNMIDNEVKPTLLLLRICFVPIKVGNGLFVFFIYSYYPRISAIPVDFA